MRHIHVANWFFGAFIIAVAILVASSGSALWYGLGAILAQICGVQASAP